MTREEMAEKMNKMWTKDDWSKDKLDHILTANHCCHPDTLFKMLKTVGMAGYDPKLCIPNNLSD